MILVPVVLEFGTKVIEKQTNAALYDARDHNERSKSLKKANYIKGSTESILKMSRKHLT